MDNEDEQQIPQTCQMNRYSTVSTLVEVGQFGHITLDGGRVQLTSGVNSLIALTTVTTNSIALSLHFTKKEPELTACFSRI